MKKKGLAVFMAMVLSGISLCGCGGDGGNAASNINVGGSDRSEERRVGKECRL